MISIDNIIETKIDLKEILNEIDLKEIALKIVNKKIDAILKVRNLGPSELEVNDYASKVATRMRNQILAESDSDCYLSPFEDMIYGTCAKACMKYGLDNDLMDPIVYTVTCSDGIGITHVEFDNGERYSIVGTGDKLGIHFKNVIVMNVPNNQEDLEFVFGRNWEYVVDSTSIQYDELKLKYYKSEGIKAKDLPF